MAKKRKFEIKPFKDTRQYVLWRRVSTKEQGDSGLGLDAQSTIAKLFMTKDPVETFTDVFSGTKLRQCKGLWEAIDLCKKEGYVLVIAKSDRCRNVSEALEILDAIGERNLIFCDLPSTDRFILTVMWAMWERHAIMGGINTKIALAEVKRKIAQDGGAISKNGNFFDHLGRKKGDKNPRAVKAMSMKRTENAAEWKMTSPLYLMVSNMLLRGEPRSKILSMSEDLYNKQPEIYCTRKNKPLSKGVLSQWATELLLRN